MAFRAVEADQMVVMRIGIEFFSAFCDSIKRLMTGIALGRFDSHTGRLARVLLEEIQLAPRLPLNFAPLPYNAKLFCIAEEIVANPTLHRTVDEWSSFIYMSARNFSRLVSRETGMSFGQWRLRLMMLTATRRLLEGETSEQVAEALGYETASAFIAAFKRIFGMTPGQYRSSTLAPYNAIALN